MKKHLIVLGLLLTSTLAYAATIFDDILIEDTTTLQGLTANTVPYLDGSKILRSSTTTPTQLGYLDATSSIQTQLNGKEPTITAGTTLQYWRGDKTFQLLDTSVVPENGNLYFTNTRARLALSATSPIAYDNTTGVISFSGPLSIGNGGTGQTTANAALNALLPSQTGNATKYLQTDGTNTSWAASGGGGGSGTVTSVSLAPSSIGSVTNPTTTPLITINRADASTDGYLHQSDFTLFNTAYNRTNGVPNVLSYFNSSGVLDSLINWSVDPDVASISTIVSLPGSDVRGIYNQLNMQANLTNTVTGVARSLNLTLDGGGTIENIEGIGMGISSPVTSNLSLMVLGAGSAAAVGNDASGINLYLDAPVTNSEYGIGVTLSNTVGGNTQGMFVNQSSTVTGNGTLFNGNINGSSYGSLNVFGAYQNNTSSVAGDYRAINIGNDGTVGGFGAGSLINQAGVVTKGWTGYGSYVNGNVGDGSGVGAIAYDASFQNGTLDGHLFGFNLFNGSPFTQGGDGVNINNQANYTGDFNFFNGFNQGAMSGNNTIRGLAITNQGAGYRSVGVSYFNNANQTEEIRGAQYGLNGDSRTKTGLDINMQGQATDDAQGVRVNVSSQTSTSTSNHVSSGQFQGGVFSIQSDFTPFNGTAGPVEIGNGFSALSTIQNGSPLTGADQIIQLVQSNLLVHDDISTGPIGLDTTMVGVVSQVAVDSGKTIPLVRSMLLGTSVPSGSGGTITEHHVLELLGFPSFGGSVSNPTRIGLLDSTLLGQSFCGGTTDCWFIKNNDQTAQNSLARLALGTPTASVGVKLHIKDGHIRSEQTTAPTATPDANAGMGAVCTVSGATDTAGTIELVTGSGAWVAGAQCAVTFATAYNAAPKCVISPVNSAAALAAMNLYLSKTTTDLTLNFVNADVAATTYQWDYNCLETN